jgi:hypothetical protein
MAGGVHRNKRSEDVLMKKSVGFGAGLVLLFPVLPASNAHAAPPICQKYDEYGICLILAGGGGSGGAEDSGNGNGNSRRTGLPKMQVPKALPPVAIRPLWMSFLT